MEQLNHDSLAARLVGVRVLEDLCKSVKADSDENKLVASILLDFVREKAAPPLKKRGWDSFEATERLRINKQVDNITRIIKEFLSVSKNWPESKPRTERLDIERAIFALTKIVPKTDEGYYSIQINLSGLDLRGLRLRGVNLRAANLGGSNLEGAYLRGAMLQNAHLWGANLRGANLGNAYLQDADLTGTDLTGAELDFAELQRADLLETKLNWADLTFADMMEVKWLTNEQIAQVIYNSLAQPQNLSDDLKLSPHRSYYPAGHIDMNSRFLSDIDKELKSGRAMESFMDEDAIEAYKTFPRYSAETIKHAQETSREHGSLRYTRYFVPSDELWSELNVYEWVSQELAKADKPKKITLRYWPSARDRVGRLARG